MSRNDRVLAEVSMVSKSVREISRKLGSSESRIRYTLSVLHREGLVYISEWEEVLGPDKKKRISPRWMAGSGWDAQPPDRANCKGIRLRLLPGPAHHIHAVFFKWRNHDQVIEAEAGVPVSVQRPSGGGGETSEE